MSEQQPNQKNKQPYLSPAMLSIAADEAREAKERERAAEQKQQEQSQQPAKKQPYQPFSFVRADYRSDAPKNARPLTESEEALIRKAAAPQSEQKVKPSFTVVDPGKSATKPKSAAQPKPTAKPKSAAQPKPTAKPKSATQPKLTAKPKSAAQPKPVQPKPKKRKNNYILYYLGLGMIGGLVLLILSLTVLFPIQNITVLPMDENDSLTETQIEAFITASGIQLSDNLLRIHKEDAEKSILDGAYFIDQVKIRRKLPGTVEIRVNVAKVQYVLYDGGIYYVISENGRVIETGRQKRLGEDHLVVNGFTVENCEAGSYYDESKVLEDRLSAAEAAISKVKESDSDYAKLEDARMDADRELRRYELFLELMDKLAEYELTEITRVDIELSSDISFTYDDRIEVQLGGYTEIDYKLALAKEILFEKLTQEDQGTLNLSVPELPGYRSGN